MNSHSIRKVNIKQVLLDILIISIIYQSGSVQASTNPNDVFFKVSRILMIILPLCLSVYNVKYNHKTAKKLFILLLLFELLALVNYVLYSPSAATLQYKILLFALFFILLSSTKQMYMKIEETLYNIILLIAFITIMFYFAVDIFNLPLPYSLYHKADGYSFTYRNYFYIYYSYSKATFPRLCGLFSEPGMLQIYINLALYLFYKNKKKNKLHLLILLLNILFAQSTSGYMIAAILLAAILITWRKTSISSKMILRIVFGIVAVSGALVVFIQKRAATNVAGDSYFDRIAQARLGIELFIQRPILGCGFYNTTQYRFLDMTGSGNSNGLLTWLYTTGIVGLLVVLIPFIINWKRSSTSSEKWRRLVWIIYILIENMSEPIYSLSIMVLILACEYYQLLDFYKLKMNVSVDINKSVTQMGSRNMSIRKT